MEWWGWVAAVVASQILGAGLWYLLKAPERRLEAYDVDRIFLDQLKARHEQRNTQDPTTPGQPQRPKAA